MQSFIFLFSCFLKPLWWKLIRKAKLSYKGMVGKGVFLENTKDETMAWEKVCHVNYKGGLDIEDLVNWNKYAILKHIWELLVDKSSSN